MTRPASLTEMRKRTSASAVSLSVQAARGTDRRLRVLASGAQSAVTRGRCPALSPAEAVFATASLRPRRSVGARSAAVTYLPASPDIRASSSSTSVGRRADRPLEFADSTKRFMALDEYDGSALLAVARRLFARRGRRLRGPGAPPPRAAARYVKLFSRPASRRRSIAHGVIVDSPRSARRPGWKTLERSRRRASARQRGSHTSGSVARRQAVQTAARSASRELRPRIRSAGSLPGFRRRNRPRSRRAVRSRVRSPRAARAHRPAPTDEEPDSAKPQSAAWPRSDPEQLHRCKVLCKVIPETARGVFAQVEPIPRPFVHPRRRASPRREHHPGAGSSTRRISAR